MDYTFSGINVDTLPLAPKESMQFGRALQRVITKVVQLNPRYGQVQMAKIDIADGFYRIWLQIADIPKLGVALPGSPSSDPLIAFPLALPMGWIESPPYFTAFTETACDLTNNELRHCTRRTRSTVHRLEPLSDLLAATFVTLTFTRQKNGVRNETIGHGRSGHPSLCPVLCLASRVRALRLLHVPASTPINAFRETPLAPHCYVLPANIARRPRDALTIYSGPAYYASTDISARSTRAGGAMTLLCAGIDRDRIRLIGRWRSDELFRYLTVQTQPIMTGIAAYMLRGGAFRLAPG